MAINDPEAVSHTACNRLLRLEDSNHLAPAAHRHQVPGARRAQGNFGAGRCIEEMHASVGRGGHESKPVRRRERIGRTALC